MNLDQVIQHLHQIADPEKVASKAKKFGIVSHNAIGIYLKDIKALAKDIGTDDELAIALFDTGLYEARLLCSKLFRPQSLTEELMEKWVATFENWEITDSFCMGVFSRSRFAVDKALEWSSREPTFEKRSGFVIMASYCMADKKAGNEVYESFLPIIKREAMDDRIYVRKAVNWALRSIGKRNPDLHQRAIDTAKEIQTIDHKAAQWIAKDALKELTGEKVNILDYPRAIYRPQ